MTTLHQFTVLADFPDDIDEIEAEREIAKAIDQYLASRGMNHATTLVSRTPGMTVVDLMASVGYASKA
ncbi:MAG: hypothetical protein WCA85_26110 [Paraburkholderia sp.]|uniref:hypothetical protein n=1 Tax=Paraburkholderia sp. TaxID=1926495 RepID=UPI003C546B29